MVARRIAKDRRALIQFITRLKGLSHLMHRKSHKQWIKKSAFNKSSTEMQKGVKVALWSWLTCKYFLFFSNSADRRTSDRLWEWCEGVSVSVILISNRASHWVCQTPRTAKSAFKTLHQPSEAFWTIGSRYTGPQTKEDRSPKASCTSLCWWVTRPPTWQSRAWPTVKVAPHHHKFQEDSVWVSCNVRPKHHEILVVTNQTDHVQQVKKTATQKD